MGYGEFYTTIRVQNQLDHLEFTVDRLINFRKREINVPFDFNGGSSAAPCRTSGIGAS